MLSDLWSRRPNPVVDCRFGLLSVSFSAPLPSRVQTTTHDARLFSIGIETFFSEGHRHETFTWRNATLRAAHLVQARDDEKRPRELRPGADGFFRRRLKKGRIQGWLNHGPACDSKLHRLSWVCR